MPRLGSRNDVPRRIGGERIRDSSLTPIEGYVLSQIDDRTSVADLALIVGLPADELDRVLGRLADLGLIQIGATAASVRPPGARPVVTPSPQRPSSRPSAPETSPKAGTSRPPSPQAPAAQDATAPDRSKPPDRAPSTAGDWGSLTPEERRRSETFLVRSESLDFYRLLGVSRRAERAEIRSAYFALAKEFHPDAYYGREIGEARPRLERIFRQITRAYEVLSRTKTRREYDEYLKGQAVLHGQEEEEQAWQDEERRQTLYGSKAAAAAHDAGRARAEAADAGPGADSPPAASPPAPPAEAGAAAPPAKEPPATTTPARPAPEWKVEPPPAEAPPSSPAGPSPPVRSRAAEEWRRLRMARQLAAVLRRPPAEPAKAAKRGSDYLVEAESAAKDEEWGRVFGLLEAAEKLGLTEDERSRMVELRDRSARELTRISYNQAKFAESTGDLAGALQHVERACRYGTDNAECWDAAARLGLRLGRELHKARDAALKAIELAPEMIAYRITLIRVYLAAGLVKSARREAEAALAIKPDDKQVKALLAEVRAQQE